MPPPRVIGPSATIEGAVDVEGVDGRVLPVPRALLPRLGLREDLAAGDAAVEQAQAQAQSQQLAQVTSPQPEAVPGDVAPPTTSAADWLPQVAQLPEEMRPRFDGRMPTRQEAEALPEVQVQRQVQARALEAQRQTEQAAQQQRLAQTVGVLQGDPAAIAQLVDSGDEEAIRRVIRAQALGVGQGGGGGGGPRRVATETFSVSRPGPATAEQAAAISDAAQQADEAQRRVVDAQAEGMRIGADAEEQAARLVAAADARVRAAEKRAEAQQEARRKGLQRRVEVLDRAAQEAASGRIDPGRLYARGQTRARVGAALGLFLGAIGDSLVGRGGTGMQAALRMIDDSIERDIRAQSGQRAAQRQGVAQRQSLLADMRGLLGDDAAAKAAAKQAMLASVDRQLAALERQARSEQQRQAIAQMRAEIQQRQAAARQQALVGGLGTIETEVVTTRRTGGDGGRGRPRIDASALLRAAGDGTRITPEERRDNIEQLAEAEDLLSKIDEAMAAVDEAPEAFGAGIPNRVLRTIDDPNSITSELLRSITPGISDEDVARRRRALAAIGRLRAAQVKALAGPGAVTESERALFAPLTGLGETNSPEEIRQRLREMRRRALSRLEAARRAASETALSEDARRRPRIREQTVVGEGLDTDVAPGFVED